MTLRARFIAILVGPGAACFMTGDDAEITADQLFEALLELTPKMRAAAENAMQGLAVSKDNIARSYWPAAIRAAKEGQ